MMRHRNAFISNHLQATALVNAQTAPTATPADIADRRELFLDDFLIEEMTGDARRVFHQPVPREIVMTFDRPWEGNSIGMMRIFRDEDRYRMYYRAGRYTVENGKLKTLLPDRTAYAESRDGIHWTRPDLGLVEFQGTHENNLLPHRVTFVFRDANPSATAASRYKAISIGADHRGANTGGGHAVYAWQSPDAVHWEPVQESPIYDKRHRGLADVPAEQVVTWLDSVNTVFWSSAERQYVMYYRVYTYEGEVQKPGWRVPADYNQKRVRQAEKAVSDDFVTWRRVGLITCTGNFPSVEEQMYSNGIAPYDRAPHIRIALPGRYTDPGWTRAHDRLPDLERRKLESSAEMRSGTALTDTLLMWSRDGHIFTRSPETFLRPGPQRPGAWMYGNHWAINQPVETDSSLEGAAPELSIYANEHYRKGPAVKTRRYTLRLDGFASIRATRQGGGCITRPLTFSGNRLSLNFSASAAGSVRVEIRDAQGSPIPGFTLNDCDGIIGDDIDRVVTWRGKDDLSSLAGQIVRLHIDLREADLYSLQFGVLQARPRIL